MRVHRRSLSALSSIGVNRMALLLISGLVVMVDQMSKTWVINTLLPGRPVPWLPGLIQLRWVRNTGAAFSLFSDSTLLLSLMSLGVGLGLVVWIWRNRQHGIWQGMALAFLLGGTIGNGIDRWRFGHVTDFLELIPVTFPIFNVADIAINVAVICFVLDTLTRRRERIDP